MGRDIAKLSAVACRRGSFTLKKRNMAKNKGGVAPSPPRSAPWKVNLAWD